MAVAQLKTAHRLVKKIAIPFNRVTVLVFLIHRLPHSKKYKKSFIQ